MTMSWRLVVLGVVVVAFALGFCGLCAASFTLSTVKQSHSRSRVSLQCPGFAAWSHVSKALLTPEHPFAVHQLLASHIFSNWDAELHGPYPLYIPTDQTALDTNAAQFMRAHPHLITLPNPTPSTWHTTTIQALNLSTTLHQLMKQWEGLQAASVHHPEEFWPLFLEHIGFSFASPPSRVLELSCNGNPDQCRWFPGGRLNIAASAFSGPMHDPDACAIIAASECEPHR
jgi:acetyl-CoA synthetase